MLIPALQSAPAPPFSSLHSLSSHYFLLPSHTHFLPPGAGGVLPALRRRGDLAIRMGGGPRTYPGGVSKWQWKRMQAKKARQLLKARLARERQLYEMRKRAELRDAVAHLERPWDPDSSAADAASAVAPNLLSVAAEDQLRALADRFHRPGGVDLWNDRDGPRVFASPATGAASARFFPRNAFHSIQPYALVGAGGEASAQGVRENAAEDEAYSAITDREPVVELTERDDGTWETANALGDADDSTVGDWTSGDDDDDNDATSELEGTGDVGSWREHQAIVTRNGRSNGVARWEKAAGAMGAGSGNGRGRSGDAFFSDSEGAREGHRGQRWRERSSGASPRKQASGRWTGLKTTAGSHVRQRDRTGTDAGSFSDSEVIRGGSELKWRASKGKRDDDTRNGAGRWSAPKKDWMGDGFDSESGSARGRKLEPRRGARSKMNGSDNLRGRSKHNYSVNANGREKLLNYMRGDPHANSNSGFAEDLEAPKWKPRRTNRARNNNGGRDDDMGGRFRRREDGGAGRLRVNPMNNRGGGSVDGERKTSRNGGRRLWGDEYSLRPTSELHGSWTWKGTGSDGL